MKQQQRAPPAAQQLGAVEQQSYFTTTSPLVGGISEENPRSVCTATDQTQSQAQQQHAEASSDQFANGYQAVLPQGLSSNQSTQQPGGEMEFQMQRNHEAAGIGCHTHLTQTTGPTHHIGNGPPQEQQQLQRPPVRYGKSQTAEGGQRRRGRRVRRKLESENNTNPYQHQHPQQKTKTADNQNVSQQLHYQKRTQRNDSRGSSISPVRKQQIFALLREVEHLQGQIQGLPQRKNRHYVDPYVKIGQASSLNLQPQKAKLAEKEMVRKQEIQRQAQLLLAQLEADKQAAYMQMIQQQQEQEAAMEAQAALEASQCICTTTMDKNNIENSGDQVASERAMQAQDLMREHDVIIMNGLSGQQSVKNATTVQEEIGHVHQQPYGSQHLHLSSSQGHLQCEECGHVCVTNTEHTSEAPANQISLDLEDQAQRRKHLSPLNSYGNSQMLRGGGDKDYGESEADLTMLAKNYNEPKISTKSNPMNNKTCYRRHASGSSATVVGGHRCAHCGSQNMAAVNVPRLAAAAQQMIIQHPSVKNNNNSRLQAVSSERYQDFNHSRRQVKNMRGDPRSKRGGIFDAAKHSSPIAHTQQVSTLNVAFQAAGEGEGSAVHSHDQRKDSLQGIQKGVALRLADQIEAASVQFMASKDGGSNSHKDLTQIDLRIKSESKNNFYGSHDQQHVQSQPKILHRSIARKQNQRESRTQMMARSRSQSRSRSKSKRSIKVGDGNILCGKCVTTTTFKQKPKMRNRLQSAKLTHIDSCPVHGLREENKNVECPSDQELTQRALFTVRLGKAAPEIEKQESEVASTQNVDLESRKIRDSIEFTSQTHTARLNRSMFLEEMDESEEDRLSEALISEIRAIASGNFAMAGDPVVISTQMSEVSQIKSNRINLLSLGAYTVKEEGEFSINAQSNFATNERDDMCQSSIMAHSEIGDKAAKSNVRAEANQKASGAYGSELAYSNSIQHQKGAYPLNQMLVNEADEEDEEEFEEEFEEEMEVELSCEHKSQGQSVPDFPAEDNDDMLSHATSYSEFYVIDEKEEARLKQVAFEKYMAEKAIEQKMEQRQEALRLKQEQAKLMKKKVRSPPLKEEASEAVSSREAEALDLLTLQQESSSMVEVVDQSAQYSQTQVIMANQQEEQDQVHETSISEVHERQVPVAEQESVQLEAEIEPQIYGFSNYNDSQYHGVIEETVKDDYSQMTHQSDIRTIRAFNNQKLYEEAKIFNDQMSNMTRPILKDQQSTIDLASQTDQLLRLPDDQKTDLKSNMAQSSDQKLLSWKHQQTNPSSSHNQVSGFTLQKSQATFVRPTHTVDGIGANSVRAEASHYEGQQQQNATVNGSESGTVSIVQRDDSISMIQSQSAVDKTDVTQLGVRMVPSSCHVSNQEPTDPTHRIQVMKQEPMLECAATKTENDVPEMAVLAETRVEPALVEKLVLNSDSSLPPQNNQQPGLNDVRLEGETPSVKLEAQSRNKFGQNSHSERHLQLKSSEMGSPKVQARQTRMSPKKSPKPTMVDRSQQDSRVSNRDYITFAMQESQQKNYNQDTMGAGAAYGTMMSSQHYRIASELSNQQLNQEEAVFASSERYATGGGGDSEPNMPAEFANKVDASSGAKSSRQVQQSVLATGDEVEPMIPDMDDVQVQMPVSAPRTASRQSLQQDQEQEEEPAQSAIYTQEQEQEGFQDEDADEYVRRMMNCNGVSMMDEPGTDMTFKNMDHPFRFASKMTNSQEISADKQTASLHSPRNFDQGNTDEIEGPDIVDTNMQIQETLQQELALDQTIKSVQLGIQHSGNQDQKSERDRIESRDLLPERRIKKDQSDKKDSFEKSVSQLTQQPDQSQEKSSTRNLNLSTKKSSKKEISVANSINSQRQNDSSQCSIKENPLQFSSIREVKSPKAFRIKSQVSGPRGGHRILEKNQSTGRVGRRAENASYFATKGTKSVKQQLKSSLVNISRGDKASFVTPDRDLTLNIRVSNLAGQSRALKSNIYEKSPKMILAEGEAPSSRHFTSKAWNSNTEAHMRQFMKQTANKRLKEINQDVENAKPLFKPRQTYTQTLAESEFLQQDISDPKKLPQMVGKHASSRSSAGRHRGKKQGSALAMDDLDTQIKSGVQSLLAVSGAQNLDNSSQLRLYMQSEAKINSRAQFESLEAAQYWTAEKIKMQRSAVASNEEFSIGHHQQADTAVKGSNFSKQYQNFKNKDRHVGKSKERRNIKPSANALAADMYFRGHITSDEETAVQSSTANIEAQRTKVFTSQARGDGASLLGSLNDSLALQAFTGSGPLNEQSDHYFSGAIVQTDRKKRTASQSEAYSNIQKSYSTAAAVRARIPSTLVGTNAPSKTLAAPTRRMQFYPQNTQQTKQRNQQKSTSTGLRLNSNLASTKGSSGVGNAFGLIHDNQHAPYLGSHMRTTAYL